MTQTYEPLTTTREERGKAIAEQPKQIRRITENLYKVKAQTRGWGFDKVVKTDIGWKCACPDYISRGVKCKHIWAIESAQRCTSRSKPLSFSNLSRSRTVLNADQGSIKKAGIRHNKSGAIQRYSCMDCGKLFSINPGFERMKHNPKAVTAAMQALLLRRITEEHAEVVKTHRC